MIKIIDGWYYEFEDKQYVLINEYQKERVEFKTKKPTGEMITKREEVGYFTSLTGMLTRLSKILLKEKYDAGEILTIKQYIYELKRLKKQLEEIVGE